MHLVDPKMMQPTKTAPVNPIDRLIVTLDDDMKTVLDRRNLSEEKKVRQCNQILQRYLEYHDHLKTPSPPKEANIVKDDHIIRTVPVKFRAKAGNLLEHIKGEPTMHWNECGEFVHNGQVNKGSNIVDLVNDVVDNRNIFIHMVGRNWPMLSIKEMCRKSWLEIKKDWMQRESATLGAYSTAEESSLERRLRSRARFKTPARRRVVSAGIKRERRPLNIKKWEPLP